MAAQRPSAGGRRSGQIDPVVVLVEQLGRQADRRRDQEQLAVVGRSALLVADRHVQSERRRREGRRGRRLIHGRGEIAAADLGAAAVLDDRAVAGQPHQVELVVGVGTFAGRAEAAYAAPIDALHAAGAAPDADQRRHQAQHGDAGVAHEPAKVRTLRAGVVQGEGGPVDERRVDQPRPHHPSQAGGPRQHVVRPDVLQQQGVRRALDRRQVRPGDRLGIAGGAGREQDVGVGSGRTDDRSRRVGCRDLLPGRIGAARPAAVGKLADHDRRQIGSGVQQPLVGGRADDRQRRSGDAQADRHLRGGKAVGDRDRRAAGQDHAQVGGDRLYRHRQVQRHARPRPQTARPAVARHGVRQPRQLGAAHRGERPVFTGAIDDRRPVAPAQAVLGDVQPRLGKPAPVAKRRPRIPPEVDTEPLARDLPEGGAVLDRPAVQRRYAVDAHGPRQPPHVAVARLPGRPLHRRQPRRRRRQLRGAAGVRRREAESMHRERNAGERQRLAQRLTHHPLPAPLSGRLGQAAIDALCQRGGAGRSERLRRRQNRGPQPRMRLHPRRWSLSHRRSRGKPHAPGRAPVARRLRAAPHGGTLSGAWHEGEP